MIHGGNLKLNPEIYSFIFPIMGPSEDHSKDWHVNNL
jgi:hypothetical protein